MLKKLFVLTLSTLTFSFSGYAVDKVSTGSTNWSLAGTWSPSGVPAAGDNVTILATHTVTMNSNPGACSNLTVNGTLGCGNRRVLNAGGNLLINNGGRLNGGTGTLNVAGTCTVPSGASVTLGRITLAVSGTTTVDGSVSINSTGGTKTFASLIISSSGSWVATSAEDFTINGNLTSSGTFNCGSGIYTTSGNFSLNAGTADYEGSIGGNLTVASSTTLTASTGNCTVTGSTSISGTFLISTTTGTKVFGDVTINSSGTLNVSIAEAFTINGNFANNGSFTSNTGTYTFAGASKTISGTVAMGRLAITGSYTNNANLTVSTSLSGAGTLSQGTTGTLIISGATFSVTTFNSSSAGNTVNYNRAGIQTIRVPSDGSYYHLTLGGSGNKTLAGATDINGNLTIGAPLVANNFNMTVAGNWNNTSTFTPGSNSVTFDGSGSQSITKSGGETFNILAISGSAIKTLGSAITANSNLTINSTLDVSTSNYAITVKGNFSNNGTFTSQAGIVTFNGTIAQTIGGTSITNFYSISQSNAAGVSLTQSQNLYGVLTISAGTFTTTGYNFTLVSNASGTASIGAITGTGNFAGNAIVQRYAGTGPTDWRFLGSPVASATIADWADDFATSGFTGSTDPTNPFISIYGYDETQAGDANVYGYVAATNVTNAITVGKGYWVYLGPTPVTFEVTGTPNKLAQSPTITYTNSGDINNDGWNLVANPYPSAIDWNSAGWTKTNVDNAVYVYNSNTGSYASYVAGIGVNGGSNVIPSSQSFYVKANAASPVLSMTENIKTASAGTFLKTTQPENTSHYPMAFNDFPIPYNSNAAANSMRLTTTGNGFGDEMYISFRKEATNNFDNNYDAWKLVGNNPDMPNISSVINNNTDLSINSMGELTSDISVQIRVTVPKTGTYSITRDSLLKMPATSCVFLEDLLTNTMVDLRSSVSYSFSISDTTTAPRFILHIKAPITKEGIYASCMYKNDGVVIAKGTGSGPWDYTWKNMNGDILKTTNNSIQPDTLKNLYYGIYTVNISGSMCGIVEDTIEIKSTSLLSTSVNTTNISCYGKNDGTINVSTAGAVSPVTYAWNNGDITQMINNLIPGTYSVTITDGNGCLNVQTASISQPLPIVAGFIASTDTVNLSVSNAITFQDTSSGASIYSWDFGDASSMETSKNSTHYYSYSGNYTVMQVVSNGNCYDTAYSTVVVIDSLATSIIDKSNLPSYVKVVYDHENVYLSFNFSPKKNVTINLYNSIGEKVDTYSTARIDKGLIKLNAANLLEGVYIAQIQADDLNEAHKCVITSSLK